jgi:Helix-turn-helix
MSVYQGCACSTDGQVQKIDLSWEMDGRKFDWIRKQLGLSKVELAKQLGISRQSLYRCIWDGPPRLVALAILGLWYQDRMGGLLEEPSGSEEEVTRKPKGKQGNRGLNRKY